MEARAAAVDPTRNVALSASAGTGKTRVLVERYINLLKAGVDPANILAMTFTRKAAAEMRQRIVEHLRTAAARGEILPARWRELRDRLGDIAISTIDAFCLSLLRDFPLEADLDPGFDMADETEVPRLVEEALDHALRICRGAAREDADVSLVFAQLGERRLRLGLAALLDRRLVVSDALRRFQASGPRGLTAAVATRRAIARLRDALTAVPGGVDAFLDAGPVEHPRYALLARDIRSVCRGDELPPARVRSVLDPIRDHFFTSDGDIRKRLPQPYKKEHCRSAEAWKRHQEIAALIAPRVKDALDALRRDLNSVLARGVWRMFQIALAEYRRTLDAHAVLDFPEVLSRAIALLERMDEFAQSRFLLEARYHHVLVDEFQDTSRAQWRLVRLLVQSWAQGLGVAQDLPLEPSIFIVGDRKQSIYGFRDADVRVFGEAAAFIDRLRPGTQARRSIAQSFRSVPALLHFVNGLFSSMDAADRADAFTYEDADRFPIDEHGAVDDPPALGLAVAGEPDECVELVAGEIVRLLEDADVRDRSTGVRRRATPGDIAILFRSRETHREYEAALERCGVPTYVYKGLGFFDADEIKDVVALLRYLADPASNTRAAALLRSRIVRLSDAGLQQLAPNLAEAIAAVDHPEAGDPERADPERGDLEGSHDVVDSDTSHEVPDVVRGFSLASAAATNLALADSIAGLDAADQRAMRRLRASAARWLSRADRVPPADLLEDILEETAYAFETRGARALQARENLKKIRGLVRRLQNHGYATLARVAEHLDRLSAGDESNAIVDALDAVNLMTVHAAKGLEFPIVFLVNLAKGTGTRRSPIRVSFEGGPEDDDVEHDGDASGARLPSVAIGDFESDADAQRDAREAEETKRLLYVAGTRARDRLYLSTALKDGRLQPGRGSLAQVLPPSFQAFLANGAAGSGEAAGGEIAWTDAAGDSHRFVVCASGGSSSLRTSAPPEALDDFSAIEATTSAPAQADPLPPVGAGAALVRRAAESDPDLAAMLASGHASYDVAFSTEVGGLLVRGTIDCLVQTPERVMVIQILASGTSASAEPAPRREASLDVCLDAVRAAFPECDVRGLLVAAAV